MRSIDVDEQKKMQLCMLKEVIEYCHQNNLRYSLAAGTMIGAVRHKGYIPWDDDIDLEMPREDYNKFIASYKGINNEVVTCWNKADYLYPFAKVVDKRTVIVERMDNDSQIGVYIDIFPVDKLPKTLNGTKAFFRFMSFFTFVYACKNAQLSKKRSPFKQIVLRMGRLIFKKVNLNLLAKLVDRLSSRYMKSSEKRNVASVTWGYGIKGMMTEEAATEYAEYLFENLICKGYKDYDSYLSNMYGDYMKLPPADKRVYKHGVSAYWITEE